MPRTSQSILFRFFNGLRIGLYKSSTTQTNDTFKNIPEIIFRNIPEAKYPSRTVQCRPLQSQYLKGKPGRNKNDIVKNSLDNYFAIFYIEFLYYIIYSYVEFLPHALPAQVCWSCCCQAHCQCCFVLRKKVIEIFSQI